METRVCGTTTEKHVWDRGVYETASTRKSPMDTHAPHITRQTALPRNKASHKHMHATMENQYPSFFHSATPSKTQDSKNVLPL